jgi:hypothetical protein
MLEKIRKDSSKGLEQLIFKVGMIRQTKNTQRSSKGLNILHPQSTTYESSMAPPYSVSDHVREAAELVRSGSLKAEFSICLLLQHRSQR